MYEREKSMTKGDCIILENKGQYFGLILHHSITKNKTEKFGFLIVGQSFEKLPSKKEIEASGILGYKFSDYKTDITNSMMSISQKIDSTHFYTGVRYDLILVNTEAFNEKKGLQSPTLN